MRKRRHREFRLVPWRWRLERESDIPKIIDFWVAKNFLSDSPRDIAAFLRLYHKHFSPDEIGDFLGSGETPQADAIRMSFCSVISFRGLSVEQALRHFLTSSHFRLPGEAQKVDRLISTFAQCWWDDNARASSSSTMHRHAERLLQRPTFE